MLRFDHHLRNTFEQVLPFANRQYKTTPLVVLSRRLKVLPENAPPSVSLSRR